MSAVRDDRWIGTMTTDQERKHREQLAEELQNFEELAECLNPSPGEIPDLEGIEICGMSLPLKGAIGGDHIIYIEFKKRYDLDERIDEALRGGRADVARQLRRLKTRAGVLVADVSGHRVTDALVAAMLHQSFLVGSLYELDRFGEITTRIFEHINTRFYNTTTINKFFTMIYGEISQEGKFRFVSAGHQPPAVFSREFGRFMTISKDRLVSFPPVGLLPSSADPDKRIHPSIYGYKKRYQVNEINLLSVGDILLLYTDGLSEHADGSYFPETVERLLAQNCDEPIGTLCQRIRTSLLESAEPRDDITLVMIRKTAAG